MGREVLKALGAPEIDASAAHGLLSALPSRPSHDFPIARADVRIRGGRRERLGMAEYVGVLILLALIGVPTLFWVALASRGRAALTEPESPASHQDRETAGLGFFLAAVAFVVLEGAGLLMVVWALALGSRGQAGWVQAALFALPVAVGFAYVWRRGALGR